MEPSVKTAPPPGSAALLVDSPHQPAQTACRVESWLMRQSSPTPLATVPATARIAVVGANWHTSIVDGLREGAHKAYNEAGGTLAISDFTAPGAFELPVLAASLLHEGFDGVVVLGCIIKGETIHDEVIAHAIAQGCTQLAINTQKPVGFGVITANTLAQAEARSADNTNNKGYEAMVAVTGVLSTMGSFK